MGDAASKSRLARPLGAALIVIVAVAALFGGYRRWMKPSPAESVFATESFAPDEIVLDLARTFAFARIRPASGDGAPHLADGDGATGSAEGGADRGTDAGRRVVLPAGSAVSWTMWIPADGAFTARQVVVPRRVGGAGPPAVRLHVEDDTGAQRLMPLEACARDCRVALADFAGRVARVSIRANPENDRPVVLDAPVLIGASPSPPAAGAGIASRPPIIVYLMDTLRADKVGALGSNQGLTPAIDAFAAGATVFEDAIAQAPWTKPSVASIFTGQFPRVHRIVTMAGVLPDSALTLAELFQQHGYATGAVVTNGLVDADFGFDQGFDHFVREHGRAPDVPGLTGFRADKPAIDSDIAQAAVWPWLDALGPRSGQAADAPFLLYVHVLDPHTPHFPPKPFFDRFVPELDRTDLGSMESVRAMDELAKRGERPDARERAQLETLYDAEIAHNDYQFGLFLDELRRRGIYDEALIVLVSDHGEAFWEHGQRGHGKGLWEELLRIPLIVKAPHQERPQRVTALAQHVDLLPTFADYAGIPRPPGLHGESLRGPIELGDRARTGAPPVLGVSHGANGTAIRQGRWKLVKHAGPDRPLELYDLEVDPDETRNLARDHPIQVRYLLEEVARIEARTAGPAAVSRPEERAMSAEKTAELRALGYLE